MGNSHAVDAADLESAILRLPKPVADLFRTMRDHPDFQCAALKMQMTVHFRGEKLGGLNRNLCEWYVSKLFVARYDGARAFESRGFVRKETPKAHVYWAHSGAGSLLAFRETIGQLTGVKV
jgi:hypothetical protein